MSRVKQPDSNNPAQIASRLNNVRNWYTDNTYQPIFDYGHASQIGNDRKVNLVAQWMGGQSQSIIVPIRLANTFDQLEITDDWTLDIDTAVTTEIDLTTKTGAIIDGLSLATDTDYLIWAFYDETEAVANRFKGFGITARPVTTSSARSGGGFGASATFTVPSGHGWRFNLGSRIIARVSTALGANYNQGIITAVTSTTIVATMDADYGVANESNAALSTSVYEIIQTDNFAPRIYNEDFLYPGSGTEYQYAYIGNIFTDGSSDIVSTRKRGEYHSFPVVNTELRSGITSTNIYVISLSRWLPIGTKIFKALVGGLASTGSGQFSVRIGRDPVDNTHIITGTLFNTVYQYSNGESSINTVNNSYVSYAIPGTSTITARNLLFGYYETNF